MPGFHFEILKREKKEDLDRSQVVVPNVNLPMLLEAVQLSPGSYRVDTAMHSYDESLELTRLSDVLLLPSKTEGFGVPEDHPTARAAMWASPMREDHTKGHSSLPNSC